MRFDPMTEAPFRRIAVVGVGAIGGWAAAKLALAGNKVSVIARGATLQALESDGLYLTERNETAAAKVTASADPSALGPQDVVLIAVKAPALADAATAARPLIGQGTLIVPMLNGVPWWFLPGEPLRSIDPDGVIAAALPLQQVIGCVVHASCRRTEPNHVLVAQAEKLILGEPGGGESPRIETLCGLFEQAAIPCEASGDVRAAIWYKLWGNATINPLSTLTRSTAPSAASWPRRPTHSPRPIRTAPSRVLAPGAGRPIKVSFVAILEEAAGLAELRKLDRLLAAAADLEQRSRGRRRSSVDSVPVPIRSPGWRLQPLDA
jgi:2-dehydropantoate 2-reductase